MSNKPVNNNQENTTPKKKKVGGARPGAGRKPGSLNKIQGKDFLAKYKKLTGKNFEDALINDMVQAEKEGNTELLFKYRNSLLKYLFSDVATQDITSGGQPLQASFQFYQEELPDWQAEIPKQVTFKG